ncbi:ZYRO0A08932p [Zygosaccharomyces rouxii]|uniref:DNA repair protein RAD5 n=1 Tax=Zygosaccharomyces rouxii (strain ATCC 2623 / CBS 732 / NBRC 1130 / NCYC 568 / NRRL Y-229) TaxID=559307 RepID=C5DQ62_ZYGRC|nr:uncharacterized protein ZYRO0A08932g [Zygosaccharomyces rouxii]KAH9198658.1 SNF2 family N-terminal domain-containing protein [Zygosaccharomyces rouxii]CAR25823.1 ZYRO0A08932p [Zygosaccharomyces rouxii]
MADERERYFKDEFDSSQEKERHEFKLNGGSFLFGSNGQEPVEPAAPIVPSESGLHTSAGSDSQSQNDLQDETLQDESLQEEFEPASNELQSPDYISQIRQIIPGMNLDVARGLVEKYRGEGDVVSKAISEYFEEGLIVEHEKPRNSSSPTAGGNEGAESNSNGNSRNGSLVGQPLTREKRRKEVTPRPIKRLKSEIEWRKFIGSLQVNAMATRPTLRPLKYGTELEILKSSGGLPTSKLYNTNGRKKVSMASFVKIFDTQQNREIGRLPEDVAQIVYPLINTDDVVFEATMVFCENKRLSIGDSFVLQLDCFLTSSIFDEDQNKELTPSRSARWGSNSSMVETEEELQSRSKKVGLLSLFDRLRLRTVDDKADDASKSSANSEEDGVEVIDLDDDDNDGDEKLEDIVAREEDDARRFSSQEEGVMNLNQLKVFYKATQSSDSLKTLPETEPPSTTINLTLRKYQRQGLTWMLRREHEFEKAADSQGFQNVNGNMMNPLWKCFKWPKDMSWTAQRMEDHTEVDLGKFFYANLHTGEFCLEKPILKTMMKGGVLSDEMGLGKTISALSLIFTSPYDSSLVDKHLFMDGNEDENLSPPSSQSSKKPYAMKTTLVIVPTSLLSQWHSEFTKFNNSPDLYCEIYYGGNVSSLKTLLTKTKNPPTVVLTTYGIVQNEWTRILKMDRRDADMDSTTGLFSLKFYRVILDEGHVIRNRTTSTSKAVMEISSMCRWVLTGTPIINRLDDLYSIVKFLKLEPWAQISYWKMFVSDPFERKDYRQAFDVVNAILEPVFLRRTKQMQDADGRPLVELPPKEVVVEKLTFNEAQNTIYKHYLEEAETSVKKGLARGDLLKKYSTILVHILRLRQICCDPKLLGAQDENDEDLSKSNQLLKESVDVNKVYQKVGLNESSNRLDSGRLNTIKSRIQEKYPTADSLKTLECSICTADPIELHKVLFTECCHSFCEECLKEYLEFQKQKELELKCPNCREPVNKNYFFTLMLKDGESPQVVPLREVAKSAKIEALLKHCSILQETSPGEQIVVFSQFSSFLDILETELANTFLGNGVKVYKFDGRLNLKERAAVLENFSTKDFDNQKVLLMSLKTGGVGLNLTCASYAFMMDPWWSPSMEDQAIDRIHRIGQINQVKVTRFIVENSIEEKMLKIQERKRTIGEAMDADEDERRKRRIDEIQMLFE